jgi:hypothetical protein
MTSPTNKCRCCQCEMEVEIVYLEDGNIAYLCDDLCITCELEMDDVLNESQHAPDDVFYETDYTD